MVHYCKLFFETFPFPRKWAQEVADNVMQVTISGNSGTLLDYGIHTEPSPLEATLAAGTPPQSVIQIVVSNGSTSAVWCRQITFTLPVGTAAADLCDSTAAGQIKFLSAAPGWTLVSPSPGVFVATPTETSFQQITAAGLGFILYNIQVNQQVGTFTLTVQEQSSTDGTNFSDYTAMYKLPKFPAGFYVSNFSASSPMVPNHGAVTLTWNGSNNAAYTILYGDKSVDVTSQRSWTSPPLTQDTCFILRASAQQNGETVETYLSVFVNVQNPELTATTLNVLQKAELGTLIVDGHATLSDGAGVTGLLEAGSVDAKSASFAALTMNGPLTATGVTVSGAASVLQGAVAMFDQTLNAGTPSANYSFTAHTDGLILGAMNTTTPYNTLGTAAVAFKTGGGDVLVASATCGGVVVANVQTLISQPVIIPVPKGTTFIVTISKPGGAISPKFTFTFVPFGLSGSSAITRN